MTNTPTQRPPRRADAIFIDAIHVPSRHRKIIPAKVDAMVESMNMLGLRTPISIYEGEYLDADSMAVTGAILIAGAHRLAAAKAMGWETIDAHWHDPDKIDVELWEIHENLYRAELTPAQVAEHTARAKGLWQLKQLKQSIETGDRISATSLSDGRKAGPQHAEGFAAETAKATGRAKSTINEAARRGERIASELLQDVVGTKIDKGVELDALAALPAAQQRSVIDQVMSGEAKSVRAAVHSVGVVKSPAAIEPPEPPAEPESVPTALAPFAGELPAPERVIAATDFIKGHFRLPLGGKVRDRLRELKAWLDGPHADCLRLALSELHAGGHIAEPTEEERLQIRRYLITDLCHKRRLESSESRERLPALLLDAFRVEAWRERLDPRSLDKIGEPADVIPATTFRAWLTAPQGMGAASLREVRQILERAPSAERYKAQQALDKIEAVLAQEQEGRVAA
ncbi:MAG: ParB N-terminal domain-containing protein [Aliidongia sp.]